MWDIDMTNERNEWIKNEIKAISEMLHDKNLIKDAKKEIKSYKKRLEEMLYKK